jgi:hypothetical protein
MMEPPGTPIPGSRLVRDYCDKCGDAIRVVPNEEGKYGHNTCQDCENPHAPPGGLAGLTKRQATKLKS